MIIEIRLHFVVLIVLNVILTLLLVRWIIGPNLRELIVEFRALNPYLTAIILILIRNIYALCMNKRKVFFPHLWNLALLSMFSLIIYHVPVPRLPNIPNILCSAFFVVLSAYNPFLESVIYLRRRRYKELCNRMRNTERRLFKFPCCIQSTESINSSTSLTQSEFESSLTEEEAECLFNQETQTYTSYEHKCCQYPNNDSMHFMRGHIPVQLIGRKELINIPSCKRKPRKCPGKIYCMTTRNSVENCGRNLSDSNKPRHASTTQYHPLSAGDCELPKPVSHNRQVFMTTLKAQIQKNLNLPETKQIRCERVQRKKDVDVIKIEDLMSPENGQKSDYLPPFRAKQLSTDVTTDKLPKAVATALETIFVKRPDKAEELRSTSDTSTRYTESRPIKTWQNFFENCNDYDIMSSNHNIKKSK